MLFSSEVMKKRLQYQTLPISKFIMQNKLSQTKFSFICPSSQEYIILRADQNNEMEFPLLQLIDNKFKLLYMIGSYTVIV